MSVTERRVQLYLPEAQYKSLRHLAREKHTSFAQIVREAIEGLLQKNRLRWDQDPITRHLGLFEAKESDLSVNHDDYLYEA
ncbi:MAG: ribbon-helix-helix protein, CopG family [Candidatus Omnitrophica bacterium]|nr:ribbon-helix-helix protein, CopG family [Candidatus Omnitrophota bacterium]MBI2173884.1 ribbon-helix-helix protein, CopG family [Candidatus Omnitrophota bacterium]MBI3009856.1 ribbon-helix-helix protein, CopG family [Candidatus Omnitrophota bacterium]